MARRQQFTLAENAGAGAGSSVDWHGGWGMFFVEGTFSGGNVALEMQTPNGTWVPVDRQTGTAIAPTAAGGTPFQAPAGPMRVNITTASAVYAYAVGIPANIAG